MEQIRDPELIRQRMQHSLFRDKIRDFSFADIDDPGKQQQVVTDLLNFLAKWLYHHILGSDIMIGKLPPLEEWMIRDNPCEFTDDYLTGIEIVDLEHQQLFCIVERAYQLVKSNDVITCYDELLSIIHELTDYTVTHFADEEAYMEKIGYEGLAAQKNAHASAKIYGEPDRISAWMADQPYPLFRQKDSCPGITAADRHRQYTVHIYAVRISSS